jgi:hypothetical protein
MRREREGVKLMDRGGGEGRSKEGEGRGIPDCKVRRKGDPGIGFPHKLTLTVREVR